MENKTTKKSIVLTGGGTAGHVMPNLALVEELKKHFDKIYYMGTKSGLEYDLVKTHPEIEFIETEAVKFRRTLSLDLIKIPFKLIKYIKNAKKILKKLNPSVIFSKGGYVAIPVCIAANKLKIPVVSHESDLTMGLANKIIYPFCSTMCTSFKTCSSKKKCVLTGSPIRSQIFKGDKNKIKSSLSLDNKKTIFIFGGSLGAMGINKLIWQNIDELVNNYNIIHIVGKGNTNSKINKKNYIQFEFVKNIEDYYDLADLIICRSGANTLFEILALNKPALLIPLPTAESRGDQMQNANYFKELGCFEICDQTTATNKSFIQAVNTTIQKSEQLVSNMKKLNTKSANQKIVDILSNYSRT